MANLDILASLNPLARAGAQNAIAKCPGITLTSGRRSVDAQASAMAADVVLDRQFIQKTYRHPLCAVAVALQACADANPTANQATLTALFLGVMAGFSDSDLEKLSAHLGGNAFDVQPDGDPAKIAVLADIVAARIAEGGRGLFLQKEGSLVRWHVQLA